MTMSRDGRSPLGRRDLLAAGMAGALGLADHPHLGSVVARCRGGRGGLPGYVALPELTIRMQPVTLQGGNAGFLGPRFDPLAINDDPRNPESLRAVVMPKEVPADRFSR